MATNHAQAPPAPAPGTFKAARLRAYNTQELMDGPAPNEFMLLAGKDGCGKSSALVAFASYVEMVLNPDATFFVLDLENKFRSAMRSFGSDAPENIVYIPLADINEATNGLQQVLADAKPGDWLAVESAARLWERAQDMGYQAITGVNKFAYLEKRRAWGLANPTAKPLPVTPSPDDLWTLIKGAHDGSFMDVLASQPVRETINIAMTTTVGRPAEDRPGRKESAERKEVRAESGLDLNLGGAPRLPYFFETTMVIGLKKGKGECQIVRDNLSKLEEPRLTFTVPDRKSWGAVFYENCR